MQSEKQDILKFLSLLAGLVFLAFPAYVCYDVFIVRSLDSGYWILALPILAIALLAGSIFIFIGWPRGGGVIHRSRLSDAQLEQMRAQGSPLAQRLAEDDDYSLFQGAGLLLGIALLVFLLLGALSAFESYGSHAFQMTPVQLWAPAAILSALLIYLGWPPTWSPKPRVSLSSGRNWGAYLSALLKALRGDLGDWRAFRKIVEDRNENVERRKFNHPAGALTKRTPKT
jgi:hypothetical protein